MLIGFIKAVMNVLLGILVVAIALTVIIGGIGLFFVALGVDILMGIMSLIIGIFVIFTLWAIGDSAVNAGRQLWRNFRER